MARRRVHILKDMHDPLADATRSVLQGFKPAKGAR